MFGHGICFAVGAIFGISDCSNREDVPGEVRKAVILIRGILMFMVVAGVTTTAAVITTMQDKLHQDKMDLITTTTENDLAVLGKPSKKQALRSSCELLRLLNVKN